MSRSGIAGAVGLALHQSACRSRRPQRVCGMVAVLSMEALMRRQNPRNAELHPKSFLLKFRKKNGFALFEVMGDKVEDMAVLYASTDEKGA